MADDLPAAWRGSGCRVVRQSTRPVGGELATVIESRLTDAGRSLVQVQYVVQRGTRCWVLCGMAPETVAAAARPVFDQAADSLKFEEGGRG
ncbi:MAG: hypothetical protein HYU66_29400 [Armatimonadetes bacterium]|nr:hypothetical protein [Armatimonadota bacterium]